MNPIRQRAAGQLVLPLDDTIAQELADFRRSQLADGFEPEEIVPEIARRFGPDLEAFGMDEVGTPAFRFPA